MQNRAQGLPDSKLFITKVSLRQMDNSGVYRLGVFQRFALRIKDASAIVRLHFK